MMIKARGLLAKGLTLALVAGGCFYSFAPAGASCYANAAGGDTPELNELDSSKSEMRPVIERYVADLGSLSRSYPVESSPARLARFKQFYSDWLALIGKMNFDAMSQDGKVDYVLFKFHVEREQQRLEMQKGVSCLNQATKHWDAGTVPRYGTGSVSDLSIDQETS